METNQANNAHIPQATKNIEKGLSHLMSISFVIYRLSTFFFFLWVARILMLF